MARLSPSCSPPSCSPPSCSPPSSPRRSPSMSPSMSPRHSDTSLNSVSAPLSCPRANAATATAADAAAAAAAAAAAPACDALVLPLPAHASTSTISRSSHASNDDHFLHPPSFTRLPKAKVFVRREPSRIAAERSNKNKNNDNNNNNSSSNSQHRCLPRPNKPADKRCVSDMHDVYHVKHSHSRPMPHAHAADKHQRVRTDLHALVDQLPDVHHVPHWIPRDERRDWTAAEHAVDPFDPCEVESDHHPSSRWATSLRNLANMYKPKTTKPSAVRGSVLQVQPPTLGERLGLSTKGDKRRHAATKSSQAATTCAQWSTTTTTTTSNTTTTNQSCAHAPKQQQRQQRQQQQQSEHMSCYADDYVGFLEKPSAKVLHQRHRSSWFRFLRRGRHRAAARS